MIIKVVRDAHNPSKYWIVSKLTSGHYSLAQRVSGVDTGKSRMGIKRIKETLHWADWEVK